MSVLIRSISVLTFSLSQLYVPSGVYALQNSLLHITGKLPNQEDKAISYNGSWCWLHTVHQEPPPLIAIADCQYIQDFNVEEMNKNKKMELTKSVASFTSHTGE